MKVTRVLASAVAILLLAAFAAPAVAQEKKEGDEERMCRCPMCSMAEASREKEEAEAGEAAARLKKMGMSEAMMKRCQMMMKARVEPTDPAALLALKDELELSEQQVKKLEKIAEKARDRAKALLTEAQQKKLKELPDKPDCCEDMQCKMMDMVKKESGDQKREQKDQREERKKAEKEKSLRMNCSDREPQGVSGGVGTRGKGCGVGEIAGSPCERRVRGPLSGVVAGSFSARGFRGQGEGGRKPASGGVSRGRGSGASPAAFCPSGLGTRRCLAC